MLSMFTLPLWENIHTATGHTVLKEKCGKDEERRKIKKDRKRGGARKRRCICGVMKIQGKHNSINHLPLWKY